MPKAPLNQYEPKTPLARLRHEFLFRPNGKRVFQSQLARELELSTVRIQQLELGQAELPEKHALKLQEIYGISAAWLLAGNPKAKPVTPAGTHYSKVIASYSRKVYQVRVSKGDSANLAGNLTLSLEALLSEIRTMIIRENQENGLMAAVSLFSAIRDVVIQPLKVARPATSIVSSLYDEATRLLMSTDPHERHRLDLTGQCLGVDDLPIFGHDGKEISFRRSLKSASPPRSKRPQRPLRRGSPAVLFLLPDPSTKRA